MKLLKCWDKANKQVYKVVYNHIYSDVSGKSRIDIFTSYLYDCVSHILPDTLLNLIDDCDITIIIFAASFKMNTCMVLSSFSTVEMEDVAEANGNGVRWFHLMLTLPDDLLKEHIIQAEKAGFKAFVITVDQSNVSVPRANMQIFGMKLATFPLFKIPPNEPVIKHICTNCFSAITWERIEWIQTLTALPIIIKGILTAEDAIEAVEHNVSAIIVSNHGGRLLDCVPASVSLIHVTRS